MFRTDKSVLLQAALHPQAARYGDAATGQTSMEPTLRAELFSAEQMEQHGVALAKQHKLSPRSASDGLLKRLDENATLLLQACEALTAAAKSNRRISPAGEWLLDNYYLIEDQIRIARRHLPRRYNRELPRLVGDGTDGDALPRVYVLALETISHGDGRVDDESLGRFISAYQSVQPLALGELWAIPIMLRLALIENLRRAAVRVMSDWRYRDQASQWADVLTEIAEHDPKSVVIGVADMARSDPPMTSAFVAELARRLQGQSPVLAMPLTWVEQRLAEAGSSIEHQLQLEAQEQAANQVSVGNSIGSLRHLSAIDWHAFVERLSIVEQTLRKDPAGTYPQMDFATRDHYRHVVERLARSSPHAEGEVAQAAIELAQTHAEERAVAGLGSHVGWYLVDEGLAALEQKAGYRYHRLMNLRRALLRRSLVLYISILTLLTLAFTAPIVHAASISRYPGWALALIAIPALLATSQFALGLMNWIVTVTISPSLLPRLDFTRGVPPTARTLVVVPALLGNVQDVEDMVEALEVHFLANRDQNIHFALLSDFKDASEEWLENDPTILRLARQHIDALNAKYAPGSGDRFYLLHRPRRFNRADNMWMGYERKRGKLADLNHLLCAGKTNAFSLIVGPVEALRGIHYVVTLDSDTQLPRDAAQAFASVMAHPLNRPVYDESRGRLLRGHGILQPRLGISLPSTARSRYATLFGSEVGIDPYTRMVSDVYQDLFGEGSFIGKGIYDVDAIARSLNGRFPENTVLSHDLIEGCYARSGLLSDVPLYEEYPSSYVGDCQRRHRWIRGDWQLLPWIFPRVRDAEGKRVTNTLDALSRWKLWDNLRRSLAAPSFVALFLISWLCFAEPITWTVAVLALLFALPLLSSLLAFAQKQVDISLKSHMKSAAAPAGQHIARALFSLSTLPHEAWYSLDAIGRTLWRMAVSRRNLLQWRTSRDVEQEGMQSVARTYRMMWINPIFAVLAGIAIWSRRPETLAVALPILLLWLVGPAVIRWSSEQRKEDTFVPTRRQRRFLRALSRRIWAFFETYVGPEDNWLPPDNMQEVPAKVVAHRTSPTNIGLALLSCLAAYDFGFITAGRLLDRIAKTLHTLEGMARYRGHLYNWYDTVTLQPLTPHYVSSVDSGNLAAHLLTLRPGLLSLLDEPLFHVRVLDGLRDTLTLLRDTLPEGSHTAAITSLRQLLQDIVQAPPPPLDRIALIVADLQAKIDDLRTIVPDDASSEAFFWYQRLRDQIGDLRQEMELISSWASDWPEQEDIPTLRHVVHAVGAGGEHDASGPKGRRDEILRLTVVVSELATMDFRFLFDPRKKLLSIGYNVDERRLDASCYDLLASEARLASYLAIAQGQLPQESWFALGRLLTTADGKPVLLSWSGSMFEYLMPMLVMPSYAGTLLAQTCHAAVERQIEYGQQMRVPWGVSESGYNTVDVHLNYQYRAFGVPGLGLKRGLGDDVVIAPYASVMALMVAPGDAYANLERLAAEGRRGRLGFYEAIDYTPARVPHGQTSVLVASYMAHHQGMSLLSLAYLLLDQPMQKRFDNDPQFRAIALLLQERVPKNATEYLHAIGLETLQSGIAIADNPLRVFSDPNMPRPAVQLLSNGRYHVMVSSAGGGYSRCRDLAVHRWHEDITSDNWGQFCYLRDVESGDFWSTTYQPTLTKPDHYEAIFSDARAEFRLRKHHLDAHTEIVVSPEDDIELRRVRLTHRGRRPRTVEITTFAELVIAPAAADAAHPAFSNLFVETEWVESAQALIGTRRPRANDERVPWMCHVMAVHDATIDDISYETDRAKFIGRGRSSVRPLALSRLQSHAQLSNTVGAVLDPVVAIRVRITLQPEQSATIDIVTGVTDSRDTCLHLAEKYRDRHLADRVFDLAWTHSQVSLTQLNATHLDARLYERMAASILYANTLLRAEASVLQANRRGQSGLWGQAISGDLPIVLLRIGDIANIELVRQLVQAHAYWRMKGLAVDLVIWNEDQAGYRQELQDLILGLIASGTEANLIDRPGGIFVRPSQQLSAEDRVLVQSVARIVLYDSRGTLAEQIERRRVESQLPALAINQLAALEQTTAVDTTQALLDTLQLTNRYGGFSRDLSEYVILLRAGRPTPAPWANVLANPDFGCVVSESGSAYTWSENSHEFRLTPWHNDPISDSCGEAIYLRDEESGRYWSPTPLPHRGKGAYVTRHGFGYSVFEHVEDGIRTELWMYVALHVPIKFWVLRVHNRSGRARRLSATGYVEWVLGDMRNKYAMHIVSESDPVTGALLARNAYNTEFPGRVAFFDTDATTRSVTCDRMEFLGRNGSPRTPAAMGRTGLSGRIGAGLDPCAAIQVPFELGRDETREVVFRLGAARDAKGASDLAQRMRGSNAATAALEEVRMHWRWTLGKVQVTTPDPQVNALANGWLMYQVIAARFWGRSGYYQSGGAFGFRDQLQDSMAMVHASPYSARQHLLLSAAHQFVEGDVQHWWHPPSDRGVRTHCSDDYLWLPLALSRYVHTTHDTGVMDERMGFIEGRPLRSDEESYYDLPVRSQQSATLYEHCVRAIERGIAARGPHGLPLIGTGDWNDGMNKVGEKGTGESVWLGFFLYEVLTSFALTARRHQDEAFAARCEDEAGKLAANLQEHAWDGAWYRRAYFDDGTPLGSTQNEECRIDSIAQSWSVLSGGAPQERYHQAMESLDKHLVKRDAGIIQLLDPPFDHASMDPGYIKGYVPGVRENGGQYTHAAIWATMAFAAMGDARRAWELLHMISPINHGAGERIDTYKVEPYVVAADIYYGGAHQGRGGWTWYTGSAGWMYRLILESLLGLRVEGESLYIQPVLPPDWTDYRLSYRHRETDYQIVVHAPAAQAGSRRILLNGKPVDGDRLPLIDDGGEHHVDVYL
ncbi:cyclic beta 1-2 glucan synthetase [Dyella monticola]|uniref:Cyclic beta 1-2 glucan synthetase n=1 Tax=Dyella monticola TaxID=1927958 RepID=A0A370WU07_9GAMM|nr:glycoside hydrolase family 94 protein [Dyella monticola]RDS79541.1 cyclic beta 1-2 glucan synthetase [Dyella monticola]